MKTPVVRQDQGLALVLGDLEEATDSTENVYNNSNNNNNNNNDNNLIFFNFFQGISSPKNCLWVFYVFKKPSKVNHYINYLRVKGFLK